MEIRERTGRKETESDPEDAIILWNRRLLQKPQFFYRIGNFGPDVSSFYKTEFLVSAPRDILLRRPIVFPNAMSMAKPSSGQQKGPSYSALAPRHCV
jgi:hypothetical protein